jgi:hypothetical protein
MWTSTHLKPSLLTPCISFKPDKHAAYINKAGKMDEKCIEMSNLDPRMKGLADLQLNDEPPAQGIGPQAKSPQGPVSTALGPERVAIGATYTLNLLRNKGGKNGSSCHGWGEAKPSQWTQ